MGHVIAPRLPGFTGSEADISKHCLSLAGALRHTAMLAQVPAGTAPSARCRAAQAALFKCMHLPAGCRGGVLPASPTLKSSSRQKQLSQHRAAYMYTLALQSTCRKTERRIHDLWGTHVDMALRASIGRLGTVRATHSAGPICSQRNSRTNERRSVMLRRALPVPESDIISDDGLATVLSLEERFRMADLDG